MTTSITPEIQWRKAGRTATVEAFLPPGYCFASGEHSRVIEWPHGKRAPMLAAMQADLADAEVIVCDCPDCCEVPQ